jgi:hypothetical protein
MSFQDLHGHTLSGADARAAEHYENGAALLRCYIGDPLAAAQAAIAQAPDMTMAHVLVAYLYLLGTEPAGVPMARDAHARAAALPATEREALHVLAVGYLAQGRWHPAGRVLEDLSARRTTSSRCRRGIRSTSSPARHACCATASRVRSRIGVMACPRTMRCCRCSRSDSRNAPTTPRPSGRGAAASNSNRATAGAGTRSRM